MRAGLAASLFAARLFASGPAFAPEDLWRWRTAADPRIAPGGAAVVYVEGWNDRTTDAACSNLWYVSSDGETPRPLGRDAWRDRSPRWSPDSARIAWLSDSGGRTQIWVRRLESAQDRAITVPGQEPLSLAWSPDGNSIAFTARVVEKPPPPWAPPAIVPRLRQDPGRISVFVVAVLGGPPRRISSGDFEAAGEPAWMSDGRSLVVAADDGTIYRLNVAGGAMTALTGGGTRNASPLPSPDGSKVAYLATDSRPQSYAVRNLVVMNADGSRARVLTGTLDRDVTSPQWSSDSRTLYFLADDRGSTHLYAARNDGTVRRLTSAPERLRGFSMADNGRAVTVRSNAGAAGEVVAFSVYSPAEVAKLAAPNAKLLSERQAGAMEEIHGDSLQAWLLKPPGFDAARKYPLLLDIQDAPRSMYGAEFQLRAQIFAARGYVVLCANPRGTPGYGELFGNLLRTRYPGDDADDLLRGVDLVVARGYIDPRRLSVSGGLVAAWIIGHSDRFAAAVARRPVADWVVDVATAPDGTRRARDWMGAMPWDDPDQYVKHSPVFSAGNFRTPTLVIAGDPDPGSDELYWALQQRKVESALVKMANDSKPSEQVLELETILGWLGKARKPGD